jgi:RNA polymerase sigma factor (sigma-70 family)
MPADVVPAAGTDPLDVFLTERDKLFRVAYRVVGDAPTAEDVVQEAWLRWQAADRSRIDNAAAYLTTATVRLAINVVRSASRRHETVTRFDAAESPEPSTGAGPADRAADAELSLELLIARLTPAELTAYLLRKAFDYPYRRIAQLLRTSLPNARQLVRRAQAHAEGEPVRSVDVLLHRRLARAFGTASGTGDLAVLEQVLLQYVGHAGRGTISAGAGRPRTRPGATRPPQRARNR